jgi:methylthioribulose-1-phosphate dehydratase
VSDSFAQIAARLVETAAAFYARGWVLGTSGNLSTVVARDPLRLAITSSGVDKGALRANQIILIDDRGQVLDDGAGKPSDECPLHIMIAKVRNAGAVVHTHSVWSTMLSNLYFAEGGLTIEGYEMLKGLAGVKTHEHREWLPIVENSQDMPALAGCVADKLMQYPAAHGFMLRRHGLYTWGNDLLEAKRHVEILEFLLETLARTRLASSSH